MTDIELTVRNVSYPADDPGPGLLAPHWRRRERTVTLPLDRTALLLIDFWDVVGGDRWGNPPRGDGIVRETVAPLLAAARAADLLVVHAFHRGIGWDGINHDPPVDFRTPASGAGAETPAEEDDAWPPAAFRHRVGSYGQFAINSVPPYVDYPYVRGAHPGALPVRRDREVIESNREALDALFREHGILHLLYAGQWTNGCVVGRPAGMRAMSAAGYNTVILRDATWGAELADTWDDLTVTNASVLDIEIGTGFSALASEFTAALTAATRP